MPQHAENGGRRTIGGVTEALAAGATLVALAFAGCTYERWLARRRRHELAWSVALLLFACGSLALWAGAAIGWGPWTFRAFYLFGAILNVPVLALGTVYLLAGPKIGDRVALGVALSLAFAAGVLVVAPLTGRIDEAVLPQGSEVFGVLPRVLAAVASAGGASVVFGGAVWSAVRLARHRGSARLALGNGIIAAGTATLSASGLLNSVVGEMDGFAITLAAGVVLLFAGFLVTTSARRPALTVVRQTGAVA